MTYFIVLAVFIALLRKRNPASIVERMNFKWLPLLLGGFAAQIIFYIVTKYTHQFYPYIIELSLLTVLLFLWVNRRLPGIFFILIGALWNFLAIVIHNGLMPVSDTALHISGLAVMPVNEPRHQLMQTSVYWWMGDWIPFIRRVISIGDLFIGFGIIWFINANSLLWRRYER